jgi:hypothetical protein
MTPASARESLVSKRSEIVAKLDEPIAGEPAEVANLGVRRDMTWR